MMLFRLSCAALLTVTSLGAPVAAATPRETAAADAIRAVGAQWRALYAAGRFAEIPELYTVDTMVMPRGRPLIEGREQMRRSIGGLAAGRKVDISLVEREVRVVGDHGWYAGDFTVTYTPPGPNAVPVTEQARSLVIFRRDADGRWRIHRDMDSPAPHLATQKVAAAPTSAPAPALWDPKSRTEVVACDRLAASRYDRTRLAPPVARADIDVAAAIRQCEADLARLPGDPRTLFHLGRLYGYAGDAVKTRAVREAAAAAGNHNAIFLLGYLDWGTAKDDTARCAAARRMKLAADRGNYSAQLSYASFFLEGRFAPCADAATAAEVTAYVAAARPVVDGFFETRLAEHLTTSLGHAKATP